MPQVTHLKPMMLLLICGFLAQCNNQTSSKTKAIIGSDDIRIESESFYQDRIGTFNAHDRRCNAFLSSPTQVAVALHCVEDPRAYVGMTFTTVSGQAANVVGIDFLDDKKDLALYKLDRVYPQSLSIGHKVDENLPLKVIAFDEDKGRLVTSECSPPSLTPNQAAFKHSCDTKPKYSGAAIVQGQQVVGLHLGYLKQEKLNFALHLAKLFNDDSVYEGVELEIEMEWPHVRSPHIRVESPHVRMEGTHIRTDIVNGDCYFNLIGSAWSGAQCAGAVSAAAASSGVLAGPLYLEASYHCGSTANNIRKAVQTCG